MAVVVTLACLYFATWEATRKHVERGPSGSGEWLDYEIEALARSGHGFAYSQSSPLPLVIQTQQWDSKSDCYLRRYYLWLFGPRFRLPIELRWDGTAG